MAGQSVELDPAGTADTAGQASPPRGVRASAAPHGQDEGSTDWRHLKSRLAAVRGKWDLAVLMNLDGGVERPGDLIEIINRQAAEEISWKVLIATLRRLEHEGYVGHRELSRLPRVTKYWLLPAGRQLVHALARLDAWFEEGETASCPQARQA